MFLPYQMQKRRSISLLAFYSLLLVLFACSAPPIETIPPTSATPTTGQINQLAEPATVQPTPASLPTALFLTTARQPVANPTVSISSPASPAADFSAPLIEGLTLVASQPGSAAEYQDSQGRVVLLVEFLPLPGGDAHTVQLKKLLDQIYRASSPYARKGVYPRFWYPLQSVQAGFYAVDINLTAPQILLLKEALELFSRPLFAPLQSDLFDSHIAYVLIDKITGDTAGLTYAGTGVVELDRRDLFGNKYLLSSVIAHEGSHVLQGPATNPASCAEKLVREIGNKKIPTGFYQWDATMLLQAVKERQVGAYHVSLWMLTRLGVKDTAWLVQAVQTGRVGGNSVVNCK